MVMLTLTYAFCDAFSSKNNDVWHLYNYWFKKYTKKYKYPKKQFNYCNMRTYFLWVEKHFHWSKDHGAAIAPLLWLLAETI